MYSHIKFEENWRCLKFSAKCNIFDTLFCEYAYIADSDLAQGFV